MKTMPTVLIVLVATLVAAAPAVADVHVSKGQSVNELRVVGQDVRIDGKAGGPVFVLGGNLTVGRTGQASNITVLGGQINTEDGARLHGDVFQFVGPLPELNGWTLILALLGLLAIRTVLSSLIVLSGGSLAKGSHARALSASLVERPGRTITAGVLATAGLLALCVVCALTVVGIPLALMILGILLCAIPVGLAAVANLLSVELRGGAPYLFAALPLIGDALLFLTLAVGVGVLLRLLTQPRLALDARLASE